MTTNYTTPTLRVYGTVATLTQATTKAIPSCQDKFNASPNQTSANNHQCVTEPDFGSA